MINLAVTNVLNDYHVFSKEFWLSYKALQAVMEKEDFEKIKMTLLKSKWIDPKYFLHINKEQYELKRQEIAAEWEQKKEDAKAAGIQVHDMIRNAFVTDLFNARKDFQVEGELCTTDKFLTSQNGLFPEQKMEIKLDDNYTLVGIADMISIHDGVVDIIDWKTDEDGIKFKSTFDVGKKRTKRLKYPLSKYDDCAGIRYQFQLSIYMWMLLQLRTDLQPGKLKIVWVKDYKIKKSFEVEYLKEDVETLMKWHLKAIKLKAETDKCKELVF